MPSGPSPSPTPTSDQPAVVFKSGVGRLEDDPAPISERPAAPSISPTNRGGGTVGLEPRTQITSRAGIQPTTPQRIKPEEPKADQTVVGKYESQTQKVEIDAICSYTEGIRCWNMQGVRNEDAEAKINQAIAKNAENEYGGGSQATIRLGMKNRMVVIKSTDIRGDRDHNVPRTHVYVQGGGASPNFSGHANIHLEQPSHSFENRESIRYEVRLLSERLGASTTSVRLTQSEQVPEFGTISLKPGSKAEFAGYSLGVSSIKPGSPQGMYAGERGQKSWTVSIKQTGSPSKPANLYFNIVSEDGHPIQFVDTSGNPISQAEYQKHMQTMMATQSNTPRQRPFISAQGGAMKVGSETQVILHVNPAKIKSLRIQANYSRIVDITGIPMDSK